MNRTTLGLLAMIVLAGLSIVLNATLDTPRPAFADDGGNALSATSGHRACPMAQAEGGKCGGDCSTCEKCKDCDGNCADCKAKCKDCEGKCAGKCSAMAGGLGGPAVEATPENKKVWNELGALMVKRHRALWDYYTLMGAEKPDEGAIKAKGDEIRGITGKMALARRSLLGDAAAGCPMASGGQGGCGLKKRATGGCGTATGAAGGCGMGCGCGMGKGQ